MVGPGGAGAVEDRRAEWGRCAPVRAGVWLCDVLVAVCAGGRSRDARDGGEWGTHTHVPVRHAWIRMA